LKFADVISAERIAASLSSALAVASLAISASKASRRER
jgi:hypothetical protein